MMEKWSNQGGVDLQWDAWTSSNINVAYVSRLFWVAAAKTTIEQWPGTMKSMKHRRMSHHSCLYTVYDRQRIKITAIVFGKKIQQASRRSKIIKCLNYCWRCFFYRWFALIAGCDPHCRQCNANGVDKCDSGMCAPGYAYASTTKTCMRQYSS